MRKKFLLIAGLIAGFAAAAQNPATIFTIPNKTITLPCGTSCTNINVSVPHIKQTNDYVITNPAYVPFAYTTTTGTELTNVYIDDHWSEVIAFPFAFSFCFYGVNYTNLLMGSNAAITFDVSRAGMGSGYTIEEGGSPIPIPSTHYAPSMIFGPYHDINPNDANNPAPTQRKIEWRVEGTAPKRRFIASYNEVALYSDDCNELAATHQMVLYENTGIVEVYIRKKPYCIDWNDGLAILGVQDATITKAVAAPGKNATVWGANNNTTTMDSCFRFIPSSGTPMFKRAQLLVNNVVVATNTTDTSTTAPGVLNINFPNVCPSADSTAYLVRVFYGSCSNPALEVSFTDTVFVKKSTLAAIAVKTDATCDANGTITVTATGGTAPIQYSINGGVTYQSSNTFTNVAPGTYSVVTKDAPGLCPVTQMVTIAQTGSITVNAGLDTTICSGTSFTRTAVSTATTYSWSPTTGVSNPAIANPVFSPATTTTYIVTATRGSCTATDDLKITVTPSPTVNAGTDPTICSGTSFTPTVTGTAASYSWSPATGVSNPAIAAPVFTPAATTTYTVTATTGTCTAQDNLIITVAPAASVNVGPDASICAGASFTPTVTGTATSYSWTPTTGVSNPAIAAPALSPLVTTTYTVVATRGTCTAQDDIKITVTPGATADAGSDATILSGESYHILASGSAGTYVWTPAAGLSATNVLQPVATPATTTTYQLKVTTSQGCIASDVMTITVVPYCIKPMEAFTPNGDGINDRWLVTTGSCLRSAKAQVFNRFGAKVFESSNYQNDWDGTYKGKPVPDGTYYFVITYVLITGKTEYLKGNVTILR